MAAAVAAAGGKAAEPGARQRVKVVIMLAGPHKGTRFRPLSLDIAKPLFPIAGMPMVEHQVAAAAAQVTATSGLDLLEVLLMGNFDESTFVPFCQRSSASYGVPVKYLREYKPLGTAGGLYMFRARVLKDKPDLLYVLHCDVCCRLPLASLHRFLHASAGSHQHAMVGASVDHAEYRNYGNIIADEVSNVVLHYAEKPETFVSNVINAGVYLFRAASLLSLLGDIMAQRAAGAGGLDEDADPEVLMIESDVLPLLIAGKQLLLYRYNDYWCQISNASFSLRCQQLYMSTMREDTPERLASASADGPTLVGDVVIDSSAIVHPSARIGPNVTIGARVTVAAGVRIHNAIILDGTSIAEHACVMHAILGSGSVVSRWARVEGDASDSKASASVGTTTIFGVDVTAGREVIVRNCIVLPHKSLTSSHHNEIIL